MEIRILSYRKRKLGCYLSIFWTIVYTFSAGYTALDMMNPSLPATDSQNGHVSLAGKLECILASISTNSFHLLVLHDTGDVVGATPQYDAVKDLWASFSKTGKLPAGSTGPSPVKTRSRLTNV